MVFVCAAVNKLGFEIDRKSPRFITPETSSDRTEIYFKEKLKESIWSLCRIYHHSQKKIDGCNLVIAAVVFL